MAGTRPSSKRKSSKRKSSKISSEARKKKRSRRIKSRKLRHRDDSSSYSDDDSRSSVFISSSSSEDESRARSRKRSEVKGSRKRTRRSSSSRGSSEVSRLVKKRKGSKRSNSSNTRKKSQKKNRKRQPSVSSSSSDLRSCSTCRGTSISGESDFERPRSSSRDKSKDKRDVGKAKRKTKRIKIRSRSRSSCSRHSDSSGYRNKDILPVENSFRRLKSVITVAKPPDEEDENCGKDGHKEEILYDHDEYPSCRSNDSNDGGSRRELARLSPVDLERRSENPKEGGLVSDTRMTELKKGGEEGGTLDSQSNTHADKVGADNSSMGYKSEIFCTLSNSNGDDLESQLKLKALENLRKHRAGLQTNSKPPAGEENKIDRDVGQLSTPDIDSVRNKSLKGDGSRVVDATRVLHQNPRPTKGRDSSHFATSHGKAQEREVVVKESERATRTVICPPNREAINGSLIAEDLYPAGVVRSKSELGKLSPRQESSGTILKQPPKAHVLLTRRVVNKSSAETPCPPNQVAIADNSKAEASKSEVGKSVLRQESAGTLLKQTPDTCVLMTERLVNKSSAEISESVSQTNNNNGVGVSNVGESSTTDPSSSVKTALGGYSLKEQQGEGKESSQLQEKTISRMRGGEMVQVSYQVYIPKKAPALARRQLRR